MALKPASWPTSSGRKSPGGHPTADLWPTLRIRGDAGVADISDVSDTVARLRAPTRREKAMKRRLRSASPAEAVTPSVTRQRRDPIKRRARLALAAVVVALPLGALGTQAGALTPWRTFGNGTARGLGNVGAGGVDESTVYINSATLENPARVRIVVRGPARRGPHRVVHALWQQPPTMSQRPGFSRSTLGCPALSTSSNRLGGVSRWRACFVEAQVCLSQIRRGDPFAPGPLLTPQLRN